MTTKLEIKAADFAQRPAIAEITRLAYGEYANRSDPQFWQGYEASTANTLLLEESVLRIIAEVDGKIAGAVLLCPPYERVLGNAIVRNGEPEMRLLAVLPEFRNFGVGGRLVEACEEKTRKDGFSALTLHTTALMKTAMAMYERRGYRRYEDLDFEPYPGFIIWGYRKQFQ